MRTLWAFTVLTIAVSCSNKVVVEGGGKTSSNGGAGGSVIVVTGPAVAACSAFLDAVAGNPLPSNCVAEANKKCEAEVLLVAATTGPCGGANSCVANECRCVPEECDASACSCVGACLQTHAAPDHCVEQFTAYYQCLADHCDG